MIPKDSTPIKNKILTEIIAKGLLSKDEMRIIFYIIRWSWGFNGIGRRQDWTKVLTKRKMASDIGMDESHFNRNINRMIIKNKIIVKGDCYQFNEHYEKWKNLTISQVNSDKKLDEKSSKTCRLVKLNLPISQVKLDEKSSLGIPNNQGDSIKNKDLNGGEHSFKETLKETIKKKKEKRVLLNFNKHKDKNVHFNFIKKEFTNLTKEKMEEFDEKYPGVEIDQEIEKMENWLMKEKEKRDNGEKNKIPKDYSKFINNWLRKEQQQ